MTRLEIRLLGPMTVAVDGKRVDAFEADAARALLAYLALESDRPVPRELAAGLLWPDAPSSDALRNLRTALYRLRRALHDRDPAHPLIEATRQTLQLSPDAATWVDARAFTDLVTACREHEHLDPATCPPCVGRLAEAVELYRGNLLEGLYLSSSELEAWCQTWSQSLAGTLSWALALLADHCTSQGDLDRAIDYARRSLSVDPLDEPAHRRLMLLYTRSDQRALALRQYETCCDVLEAELAVAPSTQTEDLYQQLLDDAMPLPEASGASGHQRPPRPVGPCPYRGLAPFREIDADVFFGRDAFVGRIVAAVAEPPYLTAVVGPSGSGKSSVVAAGLLPRLRSDGGWRIAQLRPGRRPFQALAGALVPLVDPDLSATARAIERGRLAGALRDGSVELADILAAAGETVETTARLLLVVDQFEELYTLCPDPALREVFVDALLSTTLPAQGRRYGHTPASVLLALRADFMGQALTHRPLADALQAGIRLLGPMSREELRAAIEKPAASLGAVSEAGLVERLLDDIAGAPGNLPLLEFALTLLWERLDHGWLTHDAYEAIGRVQGALAQYAQEEYEALRPEDQALARRIFVQLVQPGEGTEDTRRVATRADLARPAEAGEGEDAWGLVQHLADRRLIVTGRDPATGDETVEVVHEALIRHWGQLQAWMAEARAFRTWQERLRVSVATWDATDRDEGALLRGMPLAEAEGWLADRRDGLSPTEASFIEASIDLRGRRADERETQLEREREAARQLAEAHEQALLQAAIGLAAESRSLMQTPQQDLAALLALEAVERFPYTWQAEQALAQVTLNWRLVKQYVYGAQILSRPHITSDGSRFLTADNTGCLRTWDTETGRNLLTVQVCEGPTAIALWGHWSPSGDRILTQSPFGSRPRIWDGGTGELLVEMPVEGGCFAEWSPDGRQVVTWWGDSPVALWDAATGARVHALPGNRGEQAKYAPDGMRVATSTGQVWDAETGKMTHTLAGGPASPGLGGLVTWSRDGAFIASGGGGSAHVWDGETGEEVDRFHTGFEDRTKLWWSPDDSRLLAIDANPSWGAGAVGRPSIVWDTVAHAEVTRLPTPGRVNWGLDPWSSTGERILLPDTGGQVTLWAADTGRLLLDLPAHASNAEANWLPDGSGFITTGVDGLARVWRRSAASVELDCPIGRPTGAADARDVVAWSPDSGRVARAYSDGSVRVWDVASRRHVCTIQTRHSGQPGLSHLAWSPRDERILTAGQQEGAHIWDGATGELVRTLVGAEARPHGVFWSPDGRRALSCGRARPAVLWDTSTGRKLLTFDDQDFHAAAWSPDGVRFALVDVFSYGGPVKVWDAATGEVLMTLLPDDFAYGTQGVAWSPDGTRIVTLSQDDTGRLWDAHTGQLMGTFASYGTGWCTDWSPSGRRFLASAWPGSPPRVWDAATLNEVAQYPGGKYGTWSPDGRCIAIGYASGVIRIYPAWESLADLVAHAKEHCVLRNLTPEERAQYGLPERE